MKKKIFFKNLEFKPKTKEFFLCSTDEYYIKGYKLKLNLAPNVTLYRIYYILSKNAAKILY